MAGSLPTSSTFVVEGHPQVTSPPDIGVASPWVVLDCSGSTDWLVTGRQSSSMGLWFLCTEKYLTLQSGADMARLLRLEIVIWKVPSLIGDAVAVSFVGLFVSYSLFTSGCGGVADLTAVFSWVPSSPSWLTTHPGFFLLGSLQVCRTRTLVTSRASPSHPMRPCFAKLLPVNLVFLGSIGWIAGFGQTGSAVAPLIAGVLAEKAGIWTLHPL